MCLVQGSLGSLFNVHVSWKASILLGNLTLSDQISVRYDNISFM
jgi:hypothetical protein